MKPIDSRAKEELHTLRDNQGKAGVKTTVEPEGRRSPVERRDTSRGPEVCGATRVMTDQGIAGGMKDPGEA